MRSEGMISSHSWNVRLAIAWLRSASQTESTQTCEPCRIRMTPVSPFHGDPLPRRLYDDEEEAAMIELTEQQVQARKTPGHPAAPRKSPDQGDVRLGSGLMNTSA